MFKFLCWHNHHCIYIARTDHFVPVVVETSGAFGTEALDLFAEIDNNLPSPTYAVAMSLYQIILQDAGQVRSYIRRSPRKDKGSCV